MIICCKIKQISNLIKSLRLKTWKINLQIRKKGGVGLIGVNKKFRI